MSTFRTLALKILHGVVRLAPPHATEWSLAMLCEVDFIENDWSALSWALGSTRLLLTRPTDSQVANSSLPGAIQKLRAKVRQRTIGGCGLALAETLAYAALIYGFPSPIQRLGCCVGIAAMFYTGYQLFAWRTRKAPMAADLLDSGDYYRAELLRQRSFHRGLCLWSRLTVMICALILFCVGGIIAEPDGLRAYVSIGIGLVCVRLVAVWLNLRQARSYQRDTEQVDKFLPTLDHQTN
jgi:hypothetical protein